MALLLSLYLCYSFKDQLNYEAWRKLELNQRFIKDRKTITMEQVVEEREKHRLEQLAHLKSLNPKLNHCKHIKNNIKCDRRTNKAGFCYKHYHENGLNLKNIHTHINLYCVLTSLLSKICFIYLIKKRKLS